VAKGFEEAVLGAQCLKKFDNVVEILNQTFLRRSLTKILDLYHFAPEKLSNTHVDILTRRIKNKGGTGCHRYPMLLPS